MLTAITLDHFKSYQAARLPLAPLTVLIGANASGKSNAIEALRLLAWLAQGQKLAAIRYAAQHGEHIVRGRLEDLAYCQGEEFSLGCDTNSSIEWNQLRLTLAHREDGLHLIGETLSSPNSNVPLYALDQPSRGRSTDVGVAYNNFKRGGLKPHLICSDQMALFTQLTSAASFNAEHKKAGKHIPEVAKKYEHWLSAMLFLDPVPARMRDYAFTAEKRLNGDGANLSGVLFNLWGTDDLAKQAPYFENRAEILAFIQSLPEQQIAGLKFLTEPRGGVMLQLTETFGDVQRTYDASLLSDGTLRVLAIAAALLAAESNSLVVIEEIDNGVHPSRAQHLLERIQALAERRELRVLLSTHNPALLDAVPDAAIPAVVFCYRDPKDGASRLLRLEDVPDYPELIAQGSIGQLMTSGILERFVKQDHHPEERKARALAWLQHMHTGVEP
jgi:predicted ATPase